MRADFDRRRDFIWGIFDAGEHRVLGGCGLHRRIGAGAAEIGYWIHVDHAGKGLATEVAAAVTRVGFELERLHRLEIHCDPANAASAAIPRKLGYDHQLTAKAWTAAPDMPPRDTMFWTMLAGAYPASPAAAAEIEAFGTDGGPLKALARHMGVSN
jgi:RimJ/RimL family protein N-acetyltransferase